MHYTQPAACSVTLQASKGRHLQVNKGESRPRHDKGDQGTTRESRDQGATIARYVTWGRVLVDKGEVAANMHNSHAQHCRRCVQDNAGNPKGNAAIPLSR